VERTAIGAQVDIGDIHFIMKYSWLLDCTWRNEYYCFTTIGV